MDSISNTMNDIITKIENENIQVHNMCGQELLKNMEDNSIDLALTDPPYNTSKETGMSEYLKYMKENEKKGIKHVKTEEQWLQYKKKKNIENDEKKETYLKYGTIYGATYGKDTIYGDWDKCFTLEVLESFIKLYHAKLKEGGTLIMFYDWKKISYLYELLEKHNFKGIRIIEWVKSNPQQVNSKINYLSNAKEYALLAVKGKKASPKTFHSSNDKGIYIYPTQPKKKRGVGHPTRKNIKMFMELIEKHSNPGELVVDTFLGSGTTAIACKKTNRRFIGSELHEPYYEGALELINDN